MKFTKMQGAGNDFILIDNRAGDIPAAQYAALARLLCRRKLSVGADGVMYLQNAEQGGDIAMRFYNSDGSLGEMCGNGARCIARYAYEHALSGDIQRIETTAGLVTGERVSEELYRVRLPDPTVLRPDCGADTPFGHFPYTYIVLGDPGIPHAICEPFDWEAWEAERLFLLGKTLRNDPQLPHGANVTFLKPLENAHFRAVTFERGVEDFTLACGTGAGSSAAALSAAGLIPDGRASFAFPGGTLSVELTNAEGRIFDVFLTGGAVTVAEGDCPLIDDFLK